MKYPLYEHLNVTVQKNQKEWLGQEADRQEANVSVIVRQAVKLLMKQSEKEEKENVE